MKIDVLFSESTQSFQLTMTESEQSLSVNFGEVQMVTIGPETYAGSYSVTPRVDAQTMPTRGKLMLDDVTIKSIPFFNVSNNSGGSTVYIAREV